MYSELNNKTVFVFGAGFSKAAGMPLQQELLPEIMKLDIGFEFERVRIPVTAFIKENFPGVQIERLTLEDLFTILDKAVLNKEYFGGYKWQDLYSIRKGLIRALLVLINERIKENRENLSFYNAMGKFILAQSHSIGVISLNWDTVFETVINNLSKNGETNQTQIDYCAFAHKMEKNREIGLLTPGENDALKMMKLHGSINWLYCPNCGRLFVHHYKNIGVDYKSNCPICCAENLEKEIILEEMIMTPTMLKDFQNHHLKLIWQNAFMQLTQADKVIFIGYSFPLADYELRYFFKKALSKNTKIKAVLHHNDKTNGTKERYENFFGDSVDFYFEGFEKWWSQFNHSN